MALDAGPVVQSSLTYDREAELDTVKWAPSKVMEPTWEKVPAESSTEMPLKGAEVAVILLLHPKRPAFQVRALEPELQVERPAPKY